MTGMTTPIPRSGKFLAPGRPLAPEQLDIVRHTLHGELAALVADHGLRLEAAGGRGEHLLRAEDLALGWLCGFAEAGLKRLARCLSADLIGGANVTRLDRAITNPHPRLPYRRAVRIVSSRGWRLNLGEALPEPAQASLVRFCGLLPVQVLYLPGQPQPAQLPIGRQGFVSIVPWGGVAIEADLPQPGSAGIAVCRFHVDRLLQFVLGLSELHGGPAAAGA